MKKILIAAGVVAALSGCATSSTRVAPPGNGWYMLHGLDLTGWGMPNEFKVALLKEAGQYCSKQGKELTHVQQNGEKAGWISPAAADV